MTQLEASNDCPLCDSGRTRMLESSARSRRVFLKCEVCEYIFVSREFLLSHEQEKSQYDLHQNHPEDPGYRKFLSRLTLPLSKRLAPGAEGLDYGCGPGPTISVLMEEMGFRVTNYDPFFAPDSPDRKVLDRKYDFITCTETAEHFHHPSRDWQRLFSMLAPDGILAVMTQLHDEFFARHPEVKDFSSWHYTMDPSHVGFYARPTMSWLAERYGFSAHFFPDSVTLFSRKL
jgi:hypothetical protein